MKITVLVDNNSRIDNYLYAEPALSLLIEINDRKILFDTGYSNILLKNAKTLNKNLENITDIVLSHSHNDHTGGLIFLKNTNKNILVTAHPNIFDKKIDKNGVHYGCPCTKKDLENRYNLNLTKIPFWISNNLLFLGEIENNTSDDIDDSALVYIMNDKLFIITGCSHSGLINIVNYAKKTTGINEIYGILGGFHLLNKTNTEIEKLAIFLQNEHLQYLAPCHCCNLNSKIILAKHTPIQEICVGDQIDIP